MIRKIKTFIIRTIVKLFKLPLPLFVKLPIYIRSDIVDYLLGKNIGYLDYPGAKIKIHIDSVIVLNRLSSCQKEPGTIKWIEEYFKADEVFYDIGANIGAYSFVAYEKTDRTMKIYAFEPSFSTFNQLCKNIDINGYNQAILPINIPLTAATKAVEFEYNSIVSGDAGHKGLLENAAKDAPVRSGKTFIQPMIAFSLDDLVVKMKLKPPQHIKLDVDGPEYDILLGAKNTLKNGSLKTIQVEVNPADPVTKDICDLINNAGFSLIKTNKHTLSEMADYIFIRKIK